MVTEIITGYETIAVYSHFTLMYFVKIQFFQIIPTNLKSKRNRLYGVFFGYSLLSELEEEFQ